MMTHKEKLRDTSLLHRESESFSDRMSAQPDTCPALPWQGGMQGPDAGSQRENDH